MNFAEALITSCISPDKLFKFFDLSKVLLNSWVLLECTNFSGAKGPEGTLVMHSYDKIGEKVRGILLDFEKNVVYELSTIPVAGDKNSLLNEVCNGL